MHDIMDSLFSINYVAGQPHITLPAKDPASCQLVFYMGRSSSLSDGPISLFGGLPKTSADKNSRLALHAPALILTVNRKSCFSYLSAIGMEEDFSFPEMDDRLHILTEEQSETFTSLFKRLFSWYRDGAVPSRLLRYSWLYEILLTTGRITGNTANQTAAEETYVTGHLKADLISEIAAYIQENYMEPLSVDTISACFYISKYHLMREFKKHTGFTIHTFIRNERISQARNMITCGVNAGTVSNLVGFSDYSLFYRAFLKSTGLTPKQFSSNQEQTLMASLS